MDSPNEGTNNNAFEINRNSVYETGTVEINGSNGAEQEDQASARNTVELRNYSTMECNSIYETCDADSNHNQDSDATIHSNEGNDYSTISNVRGEVFNSPPPVPLRNYSTMECNSIYETCDADSNHNQDSDATIHSNEGNDYSTISNVRGEVFNSPPPVPLRNYSTMECNSIYETCDADSNHNQDSDATIHSNEGNDYSTISNVRGEVFNSPPPVPLRNQNGVVQGAQASDDDIPPSPPARTSSLNKDSNGELDSLIERLGNVSVYSHLEIKQANDNIQQLSGIIKEIIHKNASKTIPKKDKVRIKRIYNKIVHIEQIVKYARESLGQDDYSVCTTSNNFVPSNSENGKRSRRKKVGNFLTKSTTKLLGAKTKAKDQISDLTDKQEKDIGAAQASRLDDANDDAVYSTIYDINVAGVAQGAQASRLDDANDDAVYSTIYDINVAGVAQGAQASRLDDANDDAVYSTIYDINVAGVAQGAQASGGDSDVMVRDVPGRSHENIESYWTYEDVTRIESEIYDNVEELQNYAAREEQKRAAKLEAERKAAKKDKSKSKRGGPGL